MDEPTIRQSRKVAADVLPCSARGFIGRFTCTWQFWCDHHEAICKIIPIEYVTLTTEIDWTCQHGEEWTVYWLEGEYDPHLFREDEVRDAMIDDLHEIGPALLRLRFPGIEFVPLPQPVEASQ